MLAFKASNRAFVFERPATLDAVAAGYAALGLANGTYATYPLEWAGRAWTICTRPGVFSRDGLDNGTRMLLESLTVRPDERALDLGCGAGVLGLALAVSAPQGHVTLVDVDSLATESSSETLARNGITNGTVVMGDGPGVVPGARYTLIASNPPFHSGHEVNLAVTAAFIDASYEALEPGGRLVIVANLFLPYAGPLRRRFGTFDVLARDGRYQVLSCARAR
jgi:16S rRNA (guanine1207-N2)-methyltransferase